MSMNNLACVLMDDFFLLCRCFQIPYCLCFPFLKSCFLIPVAEFLSLRGSLNQYFWEVCGSSFPQLWFRIARLEEQYSFKATCVFFSHCLGTPSTVLRMGFGNWAALKTKMGEKLYSFIVPSLLCTPANKEDQECHELVEQQTLSQSHDFYVLDFQVPSCSMFVGSCCQLFCWRY